MSRACWHANILQTHTYTHTLLSPEDLHVCYLLLLSECAQKMSAHRPEQTWNGAQSQHAESQVSCVV